MVDCPCCGSTINSAFSLGSSPYGDVYLQSETDARNLKKHEVAISHCTECGSLTLDHRYDNIETAKHFIYESSLTVGLTECFDSIISKLLEEGSIENGLDIGSNDGTFLEILSKKGVNGLGIEPAKQAYESCVKRGIEAYNCFFDESCVKRIEQSKRRFDLITLNYVFANMLDLQTVLRNCLRLMSDKARVVITTGYHPIQMSRGMVDYVYHEHYHYFTVTGISMLAKASGLAISSVFKVDAKGGSICIVLKKSDSLFEGSSVAGDWEERESEDGWKQLIKVREAGHRYIREICSLKRKIQKCKDNGLTVIGFGASLSTSILCHIDNFGEVLDFLVDDNQLKHGLYSPGFGIKVRSPQEISLNGNNVIVVLAWQHRAGIEKRYKPVFADSMWLVPFEGVESTEI